MGSEMCIRDRYSRMNLSSAFSIGGVNDAFGRCLFPRAIANQVEIAFAVALGEIAVGTVG